MEMDDVTSLARALSLSMQHFASRCVISPSLISPAYTLSSSTAASSSASCLSLFGPSELLRRGSPASLGERLGLVHALTAPAAPLQQLLQRRARRGPLAVGQREPRGVPRLLVPARVGVHLRQVPVRPAPSLEHRLVRHVARDQRALLVALVEVPARQLFHDVRELAHAEGGVHGEFLAEGVERRGLVKRRADRAAASATSAESPSAASSSTMALWT